MLGEVRDGLADGAGNSTRRFRLVLFDIGLDLGEVKEGFAGPDYSHEGGGTFRFLPQDLSQRSTFS